MRIDPHAQFRDAAPSPARRERRPWLQLVSAVLKLAGEKAQLLSHAESPWASITFSGTRHTVRLRFEGTDGLDAADAFIAALPDHEFTLTGRLVADATIDLVEQNCVPALVTVVEATLLLIDDG